MQGRYRVIACVSLLLACSGTSSGNPTDGAGDARDLPVPLGAELASSDLARDEHPELSDADAETFAASNTRFALELYAELAREQEPGENLFVSPFSVSTALAMTYAGAERQTETEMRDTLHFDLDEPALHRAFNVTTRAFETRARELRGGGKGKDSTLDVVNQAWGMRGYAFAAVYLDLLAEQYGAGMFLVDFNQTEPTRKLINDWVLEQTEQRINELLPPMSITPAVRLVLTNAIYFKANWLSQFEPAMTTDGTFMAAAGPRSVRMMHQELNAQYAESDAYQALELPYLSPKVRMLLILPAQGELDGLIEALDGDLLATLRGDLRKTKTVLTLPRFSFESASRLKIALSTLGMPSAFDENDADFTGISASGERLFIDQVYHKAFIAVDEEGAEAAAATAVVVTGRASMPRAEISFDRPFIFLIYDEPTGQILFVGHLRDPG